MRPKVMRHPQGKASVYGVRLSWMRMLHIYNTSKICRVKSKAFSFINLFLKYEYCLHSHIVRRNVVILTVTYLYFRSYYCASLVNCIPLIGPAVYSLLVTHIPILPTFPMQDLTNTFTASSASQ